MHTSWYSLGMDNSLNPALFAGSLLIGILLCMEIGRRIGKSRRAGDPHIDEKGISAIEGAVFALLGLLLAFTFSGAASRFDHRRELITQEANAIGTAWLRIDLLPSAAQAPLRRLYRDYVESRLAIYKEGVETEAGKAAYQRSVALQGEIWKQTSAAAYQAPAPAVANLALPPVNDMIDITTTRFVARQTHPPDAIYYLLFVLGLAAAMLAGDGMSASKHRQWLHRLGFALVISATVYVTMDMEYPRLGLIRIDAADQLLVDLQHSM